MFTHTNCPAINVSLADGTFDPDVKVAAKLSADRKTLTIHLPASDPKLNTAAWTVPIVGGTRQVGIHFDTGSEPPVEAAISLDLSFGKALLAAAMKPSGGKAPVKKAAAKKVAAKKAAAKVVPKKRK